MQWALILGVFLGLHTHIRHRTIRRSFNTFVISSFGLVFPFWAFFYTKYNYYQSSIERFEDEEFEKIKKFEMFKHIAAYKMGLGEAQGLEEEELMQRYEEYLREYEGKNQQLDVILEGVDARMYDVGK